MPEPGGGNVKGLEMGCLVERKLGVCYYSYVISLGWGERAEKGLLELSLDVSAEVPLSGEKGTGPGGNAAGGRNGQGKILFPCILGRAGGGDGDVPALEVLNGWGEQ